MKFDAILTWLKRPQIPGWWDSYTLIQLTPPFEWKLMPVYIAWTGFCFLAAIVLAFARIHPELKQKISGFLVTNVIIGVFLFFFRYERIPLFGMDLWRFLQLIGDIVWAVSIIRFYRRTYKKNRLSEQVAAYKAKYLPQSK